MQIINGLVAERGQAPWQVLLENMNTGEICGGAVINLRYILTAAHCTENFRNAGRRPYKFPKNILGLRKLKNIYILRFRKGAGFLFHSRHPTTSEVSGQ